MSRLCDRQSILFMLRPCALLSFAALSAAVPLPVEPDSLQQPTLADNISTPTAIRASLHGLRLPTSTCLQTERPCAPSAPATYEIHPPRPTSGLDYDIDTSVTHVSFSSMYANIQQHLDVDVGRTSQPDVMDLLGQLGNLAGDVPWDRIGGLLARNMPRPGMPNVHIPGFGGGGGGWTPGRGNVHIPGFNIPGFGGWTPGRGIGMPGLGGIGLPNWRPPNMLDGNRGGCVPPGRCLAQQLGQWQWLGHFNAHYEWCQRNLDSLSGLDWEAAQGVIDVAARMPHLIGQIQGGGALQKWKGGS